MVAIVGNLKVMIECGLKNRAAFLNRDLFSVYRERNGFHIQK